MRYRFLLFVTLLNATLAMGRNKVEIDSLEHRVNVRNWPEEVGDFRALLDVDEAGGAVRAELSWRLSQELPEEVCIKVRKHNSPHFVENIYVERISSHNGAVIFEPMGKGTYELYFCPTDVSGQYIMGTPQANANWIRTQQLQNNKVRKNLPEAELLRYEYRNLTVDPYPLQIAASFTEKDRYLQRMKEPFKAVLTPGETPVARGAYLPYLWTAKKQPEFKPLLNQRDFYVFQVTVVAKEELNDVELHVEELRSKYDSIKVSQIKVLPNAFTPQAESIAHIPEGHLHTFWVGIQTELNQIAGNYKANFYIKTSNQGQLKVPVNLDLAHRVAKTHGLENVNKISRLEAFYKDINHIPASHAPRYKSAEQVGNSVIANDKTIRVHSYTGLPKQVFIANQPVFNVAPQLVITSPVGIRKLGIQQLDYDNLEDGSVAWKAMAESHDMHIDIEAVTTNYGKTSYELKFEMLEDFELTDLSLEFASTCELSQFIRTEDIALNDTLRRLTMRNGDNKPIWSGNPNQSFLFELPQDDNIFTANQGAKTTVYRDSLSYFRINTGSHDLKKGRKFSAKFAFTWYPFQQNKMPFSKKFEMVHGRTPSDDEMRDLDQIIIPQLAARALVKGVDQRYVQFRRRKGKLLYMFNHLELETENPLNKVLMAMGYKAHKSAEADCYTYAPNDKLKPFFVSQFDRLMGDGEIDGVVLKDPHINADILRKLSYYARKQNPDFLFELNIASAEIHKYMDLLPWIDQVSYHDMVADEGTAQEHLYKWYPYSTGLPTDVPCFNFSVWQNLLFGQYGRLPWLVDSQICDPRQTWDVWEQLGLDNAKLLGWWNPSNPIFSSNENVLVSTYEFENKLIVICANQSKDAQFYNLDIIRDRLADPDRIEFEIPKIDGLQHPLDYPVNSRFLVDGEKGHIFIIHSN